MTLAAFDTSDIEPVVEQLRQEILHFLPMELSFQAIGSFLDSRIVYLSPTKTPELMAMHSSVHEVLREAIAPSSQYIPATWIPHLTIANRIDEDKLAEVYSYCLKHIKSLKAHIIAIKLIAISNDKEVNTLFEFSSE